MSTQLILYPQHYKGYSANFTGASTDFLIDGLTFSSLNAAPCPAGINGQLGGMMHQQIVAQDAATGITPNTWYKMRSSTSSMQSCVTEINGVVHFTQTGVRSCGMYQRLSGLTPGTNYKFRVYSGNLAPGMNLRMRIFKGGSLQSGNSLVMPSGSIYNSPFIDLVWTCVNSNDIVSVWLEHPGAGGGGGLIDYTVGTMFVRDYGSGVPPSIYTKIQDGQVICDLYQEEDIPLNLSIDDFKNAAEKVQSYSKDFNLPATKRNNQIFNQMFEITRDDNGIIFNPQVKTRCVLKEDGFTLFEGYLKLINVKDKDGEISYNVNLYSQVIALADTLKERKFSDMDFSELEHSYNYNVIKASWTGLLPLDNPLPANSYAGTTGATTTDVLKYPFIDWDHQYEVQWNGDMRLVQLEGSFRPCIQLKYLINRIFGETNQFTWSSNFFNTTVGSGGSFDFDKLFMDFSWGSNPNATPPGIGEWDAPNPNQVSTDPNSNYKLDGTINSTPFAEELNWNDSTYEFDVAEDNTWYNLDINLLFHKDAGAAASDEMNIKVVRLRPGMAYLIYSAETSTATAFVYNTNVNVKANAGDTILIKWGDNAGGGAYTSYASVAQVVIASAGATVVSNNALLTSNRGDLNQWDFFKGIMAMFNLVTLVDEDNPTNILIEPYNDIFVHNTNSGTQSDLTLASRGIAHDWTEKIDVSQMQLKPLNNLSQSTLFRFAEDDDDYIFQQMKKAQNGHLYGSLLLEAGLAVGGGETMFQGQDEISADPFASSVIAPISTDYPEFVVPRIYSYSDDGVSESFDNSPRIFYDNGVIAMAEDFYVPAQNGVAEVNNEIYYLQFTHLTTIPSLSASTKDFNFASAQLVSGAGTPPVDNLYSTYWAAYFQELYNANTRSINLKVNLTPADVAAFKFYDTVFIKNREFRVNKIQYKPNTLAKVEFILIG